MICRVVAFITVSKIVANTELFQLDQIVIALICVTIQYLQLKQYIKPINILTGIKGTIISEPKAKRNQHSILKQSSSMF